MSKILYVEDELTKNIATIKKFFLPILKSKKIINQLNELENQSPIYAEDIVSICNKASELDICYEFPIALNKVVHNHQDYDLIIIDRNLSNYDYSEDLDEVIEDITKAGLSDPEGKATQYHEREGDLLLLILLRLNPGYKDKIYFLTANTKDSIRSSNELETLIDVNKFSLERILEKGTDAENVIGDIILDLPSFSIQNRYREQCDILRKQLSEDEVKQFTDMIRYYEKNHLKEYVFFLRKLLDNILHHVAFSMAEPGADYWNKRNRKQLQIKPFIKGFKNDSGQWQGLPEYDRIHHIGYNSIILNACLSIFEITSDCGVHELSKIIDIESLGTANLSRHTRMTLLSQICDVVLWYDRVMDSFKKSD